MKAIISHDIDHLTAWEHTGDLILPKFLVRAHIELLTGKISVKEYSHRLGDLIQNQWQNIDELITYNQSCGLQNTFFIGVNNGLGLSYSIKAAESWAQRILSQGLDLGLHGIAFSSRQKMQEEYDLFAKISGLQQFGMRMHYVRKNDQTLNYLQKSGYIFDSTEHAFQDPYLNGAMWEFPFQIMDGWMMEKGKKWQNQNFSQARKNTLAIIREARNRKLSYLNIIFHDRYFSRSFQTWKDWYMWLVDYLHANQIPVTNFRSAIAELESARDQELQEIRLAI